MTSPLVSIIVVTYNSDKYIRRCLASISKLAYPHKEVIVVDCQSQDDTLAILNKFNTLVKFIDAGANIGFAGANNLGFSKSSGKYVLLLNPDTEIKKDALSGLVNVMESDKSVAAAQPSVFLYQHHNQLNLTGKEVHFLGFDWIRDFKRKTLPPAGEIYSISGAAVLLRSSAIRQSGLFDSEYFMYFEDSDLSWRLRLLGLRMRYVPEAIVYHDYKYFLKDKEATKNKLKFYERNRMLTILKNYESKTLLMLLPLILLSEMGMLGLAIFQGWAGAKLKAQWEVLARWKYILAGRRRIAKMRKVSDKQLSEGFVSRISFEYFNHPVVSKIANPVYSVYWDIVKKFL